MSGPGTTLPGLRPVCECGRDDCDLPELPMDAWKVAGLAGSNAGIDGTDLLACAPGHVPTCAVVLHEHAGWTTCGATG